MPPGRHGALTARFADGAAAAVAVGAGPLELVPTRLSRVCAQVLGADGAGIGLLNHDFRVPLGASDDDSAAVERLQFTLGEGPCWQAVHEGAPIAADADEIARRWPVFSDALRGLRSFRSLASVPVRLDRGVVGALDLYFVSPTGAGSLGADDGAHVAELLAGVLDNVADTSSPTADGSRVTPDLYGPRWAAGPSAARRITVWIAAGMLMHAGCTADDAVARIRAAATSTGRSLDDVAADLVGRRMPVEQLLS